MKKYKNPFYLILIIGILLYCHIFLNGFVWDDYPFIINNVQLHQFNIFAFFGQNLFNLGPFYRPIPAMYFGTLFQLFGQNALFYHLLQLILQIAVTFILFLFFRFFFEEKVSLFLSLLFLVHPMNVESIAFIGATDNQLFFLTGILSLFLAHSRSISKKRLILISLLLLLSILTKETGFLFVILILLMRYLLKLGKLKQFFVSAIAVCALYIFLRVVIGGVTLGQLSQSIPIAQLPLNLRVFTIPAIILYYLKTFIFPLNLLVSQEWVVKSSTFSGFILPTIVCVLVFLFFVWLGRYIFTLEKKKKGIISGSFRLFLFFGIWFCLGLCILLQIIPLDMTVADRWFYFPIVGILGLIGIGIEIVLKKYKRHLHVFYVTAICILCLLSLRTFLRTFNWQSNLSLFADAKNEPNNSLLNDEYAFELYYANRTDDAIIYGARSVLLSPTMNNEYHLGLYYAKNAQFYNAIAAYQRAIALYKPVRSARITEKSLIPQEDIVLERAYDNLTDTFILTNQPENAIAVITEKALPKFPRHANFYTSLAIAYSTLSLYQQAFDAISKAYTISPTRLNAELYLRIKNNLSTKP